MRPTLTPKEQARLDRIKPAYRKKYRSDFLTIDASGRPIAHVCRVCSTPIQKLANGSLLPLDNYRMVTFELEDGGRYTTNMCADCVRSVDTNDTDDLEALYSSDIPAWARRSAANDRLRSTLLTERRIRQGSSKVQMNFLRQRVK